MVPSVKFGTSSWAYEGWRGLVYVQAYPKRRFKQDCLAEYAQYQHRGRPLFRTVGNDRTFYRPAVAEELRHLARQVPDGFEICSKVWEEITVPAFPNHPRYGARTGRPNPRFLDATVFLEEVLEPYRALEGRTGPFIFEFQRTGIAPEEFLHRLDAFLSRLPRNHRYAVEVRNAAILGSRYQAILQHHGVAHVYNHWTWMPALAEQHRLLGRSLTAPFVLIRLLTPLGLRYADAVRTAQPYTRLVRVLPGMRAETLSLIRDAVEQHRQAYVLVNNRTEGCAPLTVQALVDELAQERDR
jgi:uncharacterized protein YecE (DUF72 family)